MRGILLLLTSTLLLACSLNTGEPAQTKSDTVSSTESRKHDAIITQTKTSVEMDTNDFKTPDTLLPENYKYIDYKVLNNGDLLMLAESDKKQSADDCIMDTVCNDHSISVYTLRHDKWELKHERLIDASQWNFYTRIDTILDAFTITHGYKPTGYSLFKSIEYYELIDSSYRLVKLVRNIEDHCCEMGKMDGTYWHDTLNFIESNQYFRETKSVFNHESNTFDNTIFDTVISLRNIGLPKFDTITNLEIGYRGYSF